MRPTDVVAVTCLAGALLAAAPAHGQSTTAPTAVLRSVTLPAGTLTLGATLSRAMRVAPAPGNTVVVAPGDPARGIRDVTIHRTVTGHIRRVSLQYDRASAVAAALNDSRRVLGPATDSVRHEYQGAHAMTWIWRDGRTSFTLTRLDSALPNGVAGFSDLSELAW
jgi:hypothetical protein